MDNKNYAIAGGCLAVMLGFFSLICLFFSLVSFFALSAITSSSDEDVLSAIMNCPTVTDGAISIVMVCFPLFTGVGCFCGFVVLASRAAGCLRDAKRAKDADKTGMPYTPEYLEILPDDQKTNDVDDANGVDGTNGISKKDILIVIVIVGLIICHLFAALSEQ